MRRAGDDACALPCPLADRSSSRAACRRPRGHHNSTKAHTLPFQHQRLQTHEPPQSIHPNLQGDTGDMHPTPPPPPPMARHHLSATKPKPNSLAKPLARHHSSKTSPSVPLGKLLFATSRRNGFCAALAMSAARWYALLLIHLAVIDSGLGQTFCADCAASC